MVIVMVMALILATNGQAAFAAYQDPTIISNERQSSGTTKLIFRFNGDAGEPAVTREYAIGQDTTGPIIRNWIFNTINELNLMNTAATIPALQSGKTVPRLQPVPDNPSPKEMWLRKADVYDRLKDLGLTGQFATDLAALKADLQATYQTGYLDAD